jgi:hypothetical protein
VSARKIQKGREFTFDHVEMKVNDIQSSKRFHITALAPLGLQRVQRRRRGRLRNERRGGLWPSECESCGRARIAIPAKDHATVRVFYAAVSAAPLLDSWQANSRVFIDGVIASDARFPIGGVKNSCYGRELSHFDARTFVNAQTVWIENA